MDGADAFDRLVSLLDYPMFVVVTTRADDEMGGCLVGFSTQVSIGPPRFLVGLSKRSRTRIASRADHLAVHLVPRTEVEIARLFGGEPATGSTSSNDAHGTTARRACRSSTLPRAGSSAPC